MIVTVARRKFEPLDVGILRIAAIADDEIAVATVHHDCVEPQNATIASAANRTFLNRATALGEEAIDDLHLRDKALRIDDEIGFAAVIVDGKLSRDIRSLG